MILFLRRKGLGLSSVLGMKQYLSGIQIPSGVYTTNHRKWRDQFEPSDVRLLIRWGNVSSTATLGLSSTTMICQKADAISLVNQKKTFRQSLAQSNDTVGYVPPTVFSVEEARDVLNGTDRWILRPAKHAQGRNLYVVTTEQQLLHHLRTNPKMREGWYLSKFIDKHKEYRVYLFNGRVLTVAEKIPHDRNRVAWNVAQGGEFRVVRFDDWHLPSVQASVECIRNTGLAFGGVDVMVTQDGTPYVIEINSAPSLPFLSDGSVSYRQQCMAKAFAYEYERMVPYDQRWLEPVGYTNWREVLHPAINHNAILQAA